jgi:hypothetical protein
MANPLDKLIQIQLSAPSPTQVRSRAQPSQTTVPYLPQAQQPANPESVPQEPNIFNDPRFLIDVGARLLQPRSPAAGQLGFAAGALNDALSAMSQRKTASAKQGLEERGVATQERRTDIAAQQAKTQQKETERKLESQDFIDQLRESQSRESNARAAKLLAEAETEKTTGGTSKKLPAAEVQVINSLADSMVQLFPEKYKGAQGIAQARLDAYTVKERAGQNPTEWMADALIKYMSGPGALASDKERVRDVKLIKAISNQLQKSSPQTQRPVPKPEGAPHEGAPHEGEQKITAGPFAGLTLNQAEQTLRNYKDDPVALENDLASRWPDPVQRAAVRKSIEQMINRIP